MFWFQSSFGVHIVLVEHSTTQAGVPTEFMHHVTTRYMFSILFTYTNIVQQA